MITSTLTVTVASPLTGQAVWAASSDARQLWSIVALLAALGLGLAMLAVVVFRATRPDRELLAPLEMMGRRKWRRSDPVWQRRQLDAVRPAGAQPLTTAPALPVPVEEFDDVPETRGFEDLRADSDASSPAGADLDVADVDTGIAGALTELPGGEVFDSDPTPPSREVPAIVPGDAAEEGSLAQLGVDWSPPAVEDLNMPADRPVLQGDDDATNVVG